MLLFQVCDVLAMAAHNLVYFRSGLPAPSGVQLLVEDEVVGLHSSEQVEVTLVAYYSARCLLAPYFRGLRVLLAEWEAARLSASIGCPRLGGVGGLFVLLLSKFCILILSYFLTFYF